MCVQATAVAAGYATVFPESSASECAGVAVAEALASASAGVTALATGSFHTCHGFTPFIAEELVAASWQHACME